MAAWPSFDAPAVDLNGDGVAEDIRMFASAEVEIKVSTKTVSTDAPVNPINFAGTPNNMTIQMGNNSVEVKGEDSGGSSNVPAANVQAAAFLNEFTEDFAEEAKTFMGTSTDPDDEGDLTTDESKTITNTTPASMTVDNLKTAYSYYNGLLSSASNLPAFPGNGKLDLLGDPNAVYKANNLNIAGGKQLTGEGTLILTSTSLKVIGHGAKIDWKGNIVFIDNGHTELQLDNSGEIKVDGAFLILTADTGATSEANLQVQGGAKLEVKGIFATMADHIQVQFQNGAHIKSNSMNFAFPDPNTFEWQDQNGAQIDLIHHSVETNEALAGLEIIPGWTGATKTIKFMSMKSYWEPGTSSVLSDQSSQFSASGSGPWGYVE